MDIQGLINGLNGVIQNWQQIAVAAAAIPLAIGALLSAINSLLKLIAPLTPWTWDNHLSEVIGKWAAAKIFNKK